MKTLEKARKDIVKVDKKIKKLFLKRMKLSKEIGKIKKENNLPILDETRENYLKETYTKDLFEYKNEYLELLDTILKISKDSMKKD